MYFKDGQLVIEDAKENIMFMNLINNKSDKDIVSNIETATENFRIVFKQGMKDRGWDINFFEGLK